MLRVIFSIGAVQVLAILVNTVRAKVFAVLLGPAGFGVVATIDQLVASTSQFSNLSLPFTALKHLSRGHSIGELEFKRSYQYFLKAICIVACAATLIATSVIPPNLARFDSQLARYQGPVTVALLGVPAAMLLVFFANVLAARQRTLQSVLLNTFSMAVATFCGWLGCQLGGIQGIYNVTVPVSTILVFGIILFARKWMRPSASLGARACNLAVAEKQVPILETAFFTYIAVCSYSGLLLVARYVSISNVSEEAAGLLQAGLAVALSVGAVIGPANAMYFTPYVNRSTASTEKMLMANNFLPRLTLFFCLGALPVLLFPETLSRILFSHRFIAATPLFLWFLIWQCLYQMANVYQQLLIGMDDVKGCCILTVLGNVLAAFLCLVWVDKFGLFGIAAAFLASGLAIGGLTVFRLWRKHQLVVPIRVGGFCIFAVFGFSGVALVSQITSEISVEGLAMRALLALGFVTLLWLILPLALREELTVGVADALHKLRSRCSASR